MSENVQKLTDLLGFDPSKTNPNSVSVQEALDEIRIEKAQETKRKAKELLLEAMKLKNTHDETVKQFQAADQKFEKTLGKILNHINEITGANQ